MSDMLGRGYIQVYTGNGKGKTTAALGLSWRAAGRGLHVLIIQFMKGRGYGEHLLAERLKPEIELVQVGKPYFVAREGEIDPEMLEEMNDSIRVFPPGDPPKELVDLAHRGLKIARKAFAEGSADVVVLDEINVTLHFGLLDIEEVLEIMDCKPDGVELVLTGRYAPERVIDKADLVTEMCEIKHYFNDGVMSRKGIEE